MKRIKNQDLTFSAKIENKILNAYETEVKYYSNFPQNISYELFVSTKNTEEASFRNYTLNSNHKKSKLCEVPD